jgi:TNF receptor-associated protein 1
MFKKIISTNFIIKTLKKNQIKTLINLKQNIRLFSVNKTFNFEKIKEIKDDDDVVKEDEENLKENDEKLRTEGLITETEVLKGEKEVSGFQTETKQLLNIVAQSLYTDKEVFIRELISNASDALEKLRETQLTKTVEDSDKPLQIMISVDDKLKTFTIQDTGIGMTKEELKQNIGTIAFSGSKTFVQKLQEEGKNKEAVSNIIGQFGVGFYSVFMVATKVKVYTRSATEGSKGYCWESYGGSEYTINEAEGVARGTKIILYLKEEEKEFSMKEHIESKIKYKNRNH